VETSPRISTPSTNLETTLRLGNNFMAAISGQSSCAAPMREKSTGCAAATAVLDSTEMAEIGKLGGVEDGKADGITVGTEAGRQLAGDGAVGGVGGDGRLRASATMLAVPEVCPDVRSEFCYKGEVALLSCRPRRRNAEHGGNQRLVVCEEMKMATFKQKPEVANGGVGGQQLSVKGGIFLLCRRQFFGEKGQRRPSPLLVLWQNPTHV
jgi:hypothetical protein